MHNPDLYMLWYPLLAEFEHVRDIHHAAYQSLCLLKAAHSEAVRANTKETPKLQRKFEHQRRQERRQPKRTKMASGTVTNTGRCQKLQRRCANCTDTQLRMQPKVRRGDQSCCTVRLQRGHFGRAKLERDQTKSNKIKRNQDLTLASPRVCPCLKLMYLSTAKIQIICSRQRCKKSNFEQRSISKFIAVQVIPRTCG